jgi:hypothetical protein
MFIFLKLKIHELQNLKRASQFLSLLKIFKLKFRQYGH